MTTVIRGTDDSASTPALTGTDADTGVFFPAANTMAMSTGGSERMRIDSSGNVGIGTTSPSVRLNVTDSADGGNSGTIRLGSDGTYYAQHQFRYNSSEYRFGTYGAGQFMSLYTAGSERARITSDGTIIVGKTATSFASAGVNIYGNGEINITRSDGIPLYIRRNTSDGVLVSFYKDGTEVGVIGTTTSRLYIGSGDTGLDFEASTDAVRPMNTTTGSGRDNAIDLGRPDVRFRDAYITDGVTTGSDRNDKQDIEELSEAETRVAVACKGLLRKWRWKEAVAEKGDDARIHFGIIAQDLKAAFEAEGLDAGRYAMFIHSAWWEKERVIPAVEADEENGIEAKEAYTRIDTYQTEAEAPEGAVRKERMGIRYNELLAFMVAAL